jgi:hypothetical protein
MFTESSKVKYIRQFMLKYKASSTWVQDQKNDALLGFQFLVHSTSTSSSSSLSYNAAADLPDSGPRRGNGRNQGGRGTPYGRSQRDDGRGDRRRDDHRGAPRRRRYYSDDGPPNFCLSRVKKIGDCKYGSTCNKDHHCADCGRNHSATDHGDNFDESKAARKDRNRREDNNSGTRPNYRGRGGARGAPPRRPSLTARGGF